MVALRASAVAGAGSQRTTHHAVQVSRARTYDVTGVVPVPLGVTGNTPDSGSGESWFEPRRGNQSRSEVLRLFDCPSGLFAACCASRSSPGGATWKGRSGLPAALPVQLIPLGRRGSSASQRSPRVKLSGSNLTWLYIDRAHQLVRGYRRSRPCRCGVRKLGPGAPNPCRSGRPQCTSPAALGRGGRDLRWFAESLRTTVHVPVGTYRSSKSARRPTQERSLRPRLT